MPRRLLSLLLAPTRLLLSLRSLLARGGLAVAAVASGAAFALWAVALLLRRGPGAASGRQRRHRDRDRDRAPAALRDPTCGEHRTLRLRSSGLRLHYVTRGPPDAPLMLLLHGFPQNWFCWRHLLREFGGRFRVVAPDLRGYGDSEKPPGRDSYRLELLLGDVRDLIEALGTPAAAPRCVLVGHDWGGLLAWEVASRHPRLVEKLVVMDAPHRAVMAAAPLLLHVPVPAALAARAAAVPGRLRAGAVVHDQRPDRHPGPGAAPLGAGARRLPVRPLPARGLSPPIHYYRNLFGATPIPREPPPPPTLLLWGSRDAFLDPRLGPAHLRWLRPSARLRLLPGASHWLPDEAPRLLAKLIGEFLGGGAEEGS
ncbi:epoxide hydrolase 3-like isoform X1 [Melospiza melodia melodia]|uniref:epoxide hydrolase 3-like isoform X1 n=1 Tax=Melospiza melodia melodia TaxID=1914991 RepID=UPI002FD286B0